MDHPTVEVQMNERAIRALHSSVCFTLDRWAGQEKLDQEQLISLKHSLQGCIFEFDLDKDIGI